MVDAFEARDAALGSLFSEYHDCTFQIPDFQRRFVWGKDEFTDFLESIIRNPEGYFIGTFVYAPSEHTDNDANSINIIDGQQRLVTLFITMAALRDLLESSLQEGDEPHVMHDDIQEAVAELRKWLLIRKNGDRRVKIEFSDDTMNKFFKSITERHTTPEALEQIGNYAYAQVEEASEKILHKKVAGQFIEAYKIIKSTIEENAPSLKDQCELVDKIRDLQIIKFKCKRYELVHSLFEGLNSKGIKLTRSEQIKNILFYSIEQAASNEDEAKTLKEKWNDLEYLFDSHEVSKNLIDKFLRHYWVAKHKLIYMPQLYEAYKKNIEQLSSAENIASFLDELMSNARFYIGVKEASLNQSDFTFLSNADITEKLNSFSLLDNDQILEILLLYRVIIMNRLVSTKVLKQWLNDFWVITFRLKYVSVSPSDFEKELVKYLVALRRVIESESSVREHDMIQITRGVILDKLWPLVNNSDLFVKNISEKLNYSQNNNSIIKKVISDLLLTMSPTIVIKSPSIEHILPQKPAKWGFTGKEVKDIVNKFGNLTLLNNTDNQDAGNELFSVKVKSVYRLSHFRLNKNIESYVGFSSKNLLDIEQSINRRGLEIAQAIEAIYKIKTS
jgi:uncharacterized protein with ParB-like and HNH nuclease domain